MILIQKVSLLDVFAKQKLLRLERLMKIFYLALLLTGISHVGAVCTWPRSDVLFVIDSTSNVDTNVNHR